MTREKAAELLTQGAAIKHKYFNDDEFIFLNLKTGKIMTNDEIDFTERFWKLE